MMTKTYFQRFKSCITISTFESKKSQFAMISDKSEHVLMFLKVANVLFNI